VTQDTPAFFTLDRGTVSTTAALIAPVDGRYRLLAAAAAPVALEPESLFEDLAWRVARTDASVAGSMEGWRDWARLEVRTTRPARAVLVAASAETGELLERAFTAAGWSIRARFFGPDPELIAFGEACLDPEIDAVVMGGRDDVEEAERDAAHRLWPRAAALARFRDDLAVIACGPFADRPEGIPDGRLFSLPAPAPAPATSESVLRQAAQQVGRHLADPAEPTALDGRSTLRAAMVSLAHVLGSRVEGIEVGVGASSRTLAGPQGELKHGVFAAAGSLPLQLLDDEELGDAVLRWCTLSGSDPSIRLDALRELVLHPWAADGSDGAHLRLAALRSALERLEAAWHGSDTPGDEPGAGVTVLAGGAFAGLPPAESVLAVIDSVRQPGAMSILHDHAGVLAPHGALPVEADRQRLLSDLMGDSLLPLGSALLTGTLEERKKDRAVAAMSIASSLGDQRLRLDPGQLQLVDLPPGVVANVGIDPGEGAVLGVSGRTVTLEVSGGLGGMFVDTRPTTLELPATGEARRSLLEDWEAPAWVGTER
jgi:hypothetical protein